MAEGWAVSALAALDEAAFAGAVEARFRRLYQEQFEPGLGMDEGINHALPVQVRALRDMAPWRVFLLLTPWMMARLFVARSDPGLAVPAGWGASERGSGGYVVIGPPRKVAVFGEAQPAHVNYDPDLGHYLIQPLVQAMTAYADAEAVFSAWNEVIARRQRAMEEMQRECSWQKELSRREFLARLRGA